MYLPRRVKSLFAALTVTLLLSPCAQADELWISPMRFEATEKVGNWAVTPFGNAYFTFAVPDRFGGFDSAKVVVIGTSDRELRAKLNLSVAEGKSSQDDYTDRQFVPFTLTSGQLLEVDVSEIVKRVPLGLFEGSDYVSLKFITSPQKDIGDVKILGMRFVYTARPLGEDNEAIGDGATVGGGFGNRALEEGSTVAGGGFNGALGLASTIGGGGDNGALGDASTIAGGGSNVALGEGSTVSGGALNSAEGDGSVVGGGIGNEAVGESSTVGGGDDNVAAAPFSTASGGSSNIANGDHATVTGGSSNIASGDFSTVSGGESNLARGDWSWSGGRNAKAMHKGSFVWCSSSLPLESTANNQFNVQALGGTRIISGVESLSVDRPPTIFGVKLEPNAGAWSTLSDRATKDHIQEVDGRTILEQLVQVPIATWNWKGQDPSVRHIGPMAQDFYEAFNVGEDERRISTVDTDGVALASIQGLHELLNEALNKKNDEIKQLNQRILEMEKKFERLEL